MPRTDVCSVCEKPVYRGRTSRPEIVCHECRRQQPAPYKPGGTDRSGKRRIPATCEHCGAEFGSRRSRRGWTRYCSKSCAARARSEGNPSRRLRNCEICGEQYKASRGDQRTCSRACGTKIHRRTRERAQWPSSPVYIRNCAYCATVFVGRKPVAKFCSPKCNRDSRRPQERHCACGQLIPLKRQKCDACVRLARKERRRREKKAAEARKRGIKQEPYTLAEIAVRDRYRCGLCRKRVAMTKAVPHPKAPSIDHVLPIACGGDDTRANVQLAHFSCNARKHVGGSQQLALIG